MSLCVFVRQIHLIQTLGSNIQQKYQITEVQLKHTIVRLQQTVSTFLCDMRENENLEICIMQLFNVQLQGKKSNAK
jgi:hypothetical protein